MATARDTKEKTRSQTGAKRSAEQRRSEAARGTTIPVPVPEVHTRQVAVPGKLEEAKQALAGRRRPPGQLLAFYGALAAGAVFGAIDWPVAAAVGVGTIVARRSRS